MQWLKIVKQKKNKMALPTQAWRQHYRNRSYTRGNSAAATARLNSGFEPWHMPAPRKTLQSIQTRKGRQKGKKAALASAAGLAGLAGLGGLVAGLLKKKSEKKGNKSKREW